MAQDFHAVFGTGSNDTSLAVMDASEVALASIQALNRKLEQENLALSSDLDLLISENQKLKSFLVQNTDLLTHN